MGPNDILRMLQGCHASAILRAAVELEVFSHLSRAAADAGAVASAIGADRRGTRILLDALAALGVVEVEEEKYRLSPAADSHLVPGRPAYLGDLARLYTSDYLWDALKQIPGAVRRGGTVLQRHAETPGHPFWEEFAAYSAATAGAVAESLCQLLAPWAAARMGLDVLDVACGTGLYGFTFARHQTRARVWSLDWPNVLPAAREHAERLGVLARVRFIEGDMFGVELGGPYDLIILSQVFHHYSEDRCVALLRRLAGALRADGRLAIHGPVPAQAGPADDPFPFIFSLLMLIWTREGQAHSVSAYRRMLGATGFAPPVVHSPAGMTTRFLFADRSA